MLLQYVREPVNTPFFNKAERYGTVYAFKKLFMADQKAVVSKAIDDSIRCKEISVYGRTMRAYRVLAKSCSTSFYNRIIEFNA